VPVVAQIVILLALTAGLFDSVALDRMTAAEDALRQAAADIPADLRARFESAEKLSDADRKTVIETARQALIPFQPKPEPKEGKSAPKPDPGPTAKTGIGTKPGPAAEPKPDAAKTP